MVVELQKHRDDNPRSAVLCLLANLLAGSLAGWAYTLHVLHVRWLQTTVLSLFPVSLFFSFQTWMHGCMPLVKIVVNIGPFHLVHPDAFKVVFSEGYYSNRMQLLNGFDWWDAIARMTLAFLHFTSFCNIVFFFFYVLPNLHKANFLQFRHNIICDCMLNKWWTLKQSIIISQMDHLYTKKNTVIIKQNIVHIFFYGQWLFASFTSGRSDS